MGMGKNRGRPDDENGRKRDNRLQNSSKPSSRSKPTTNTRPISIRPPRRSSFRAVLGAVFLVVLLLWHVIVLKILKTITFDNESQKDQILPILLVGGSDGSGTRAVVETLRDLGTVVVSEDKGTFDVHAGQIAEGWPGLIKRIFLPFGRKGFFSTEERQPLNFDSNPVVLSSDGNSASSLKANFDWPPQKIDLHNKDYEKDTKRVERDVEKLMKSWDSLKKSFTRGRGVKKKMYPDGKANDVAYAIKAPVSMLALPVFVSYFSSRNKRQQSPRPLKFLHVIRDGRDVALSDNQSPVIKFYNLTYPKQIQDHETHRSKFSDSSLQHKNPDRMYARAMQLWNDWNLVVHRWGMTHNINNRATLKNSDDVVPVVDYLWVRSEDLLVPGSQKRFDALTAIAKLVGSSLTAEELCCLSQQETRDHGKSNNAHSGAGAGAGAALKIARGKLFNPKQFNPKQATGGLANAKRYSDRDRVRADEKYMYDNWKAFVSAALLNEHESKAYIHHLIQQGEELLAVTREKWKMNPDTVEAEILVPLRKMKMKLGHRRLLAEIPHNRHTARIKVDNNNNHNNTKLGAGHPAVSKRYGKWQKVLENKTELSSFFHREGAEGLQVFGYHPYRRINYIEQYGDNGDYNGDKHNNTESLNRKSVNIYNNKPVADDEELEDGETLPGICQVSVACPRKKNY